MSSESFDTTAEAAASPVGLFLGFGADWWIAAVPIALYFASLFVCLSHAFVDMAWGVRKRHVGDARKVSLSTAKRYTVLQRLGIALRNFALVAFGLFNFALAWYHIRDFMESDRAKYPSFAVWVSEGDWFVQAYRLVTGTPQQWFISSQLLQGVGTIVVFTYVESIRCGRIRPLSSFWLGCSAAISLSTPLFMAAVFNTPREVTHRRFYVPVNSFLVLCVLVSSVATTFLPLVETSLYKVILAAIHISLLAPLALLQWLPKAFEAAEQSYAVNNDVVLTRRRLVLHSVASLWVPATYALLAGMGFTTQLANFILNMAHTKGPDDLIVALRDAFCANSCQCSISGDVLAVSVLSMAFMVLSPTVSKRVGVTLALLTPVLSFAATLPAFLALREIQTTQRRAAVAEKMLVTSPHGRNVIGIKRVPPSPSNESLGDAGAPTPPVTRATPEPDPQLGEATNAAAAAAATADAAAAPAAPVTPTDAPTAGEDDSAQSKSQQQLRRRKPRA